MDTVAPVCATHLDLDATHRVRAWGSDGKRRRHGTGRWLYLCAGCAAELALDFESDPGFELLVR